jgi:hypothetical protein
MTLKDQLSVEMTITGKETRAVGAQEKKVVKH